MHELGVVLEIFDLVEEIMKEQGLKKVSSITVEVGELSGILPDYLSECWKVARLGGTFDNTELKLIHIPATARCTCGAEYEMTRNNRICPKCHKTDYEVIKGREFMVLSIEAC
ncbi:MAG: hydrogenase maturation nickel metallochaperone HypA [Eubacterium sp.]|nr:hydrogenase maturation nickel metallochaperone HypA [Eubacterium sp.]MDE6156226.1 hydrogenase maturation nickel metallochaperone HypA [Eubacterium sp.]MDE6767154.1 hydrogenase maturation nickel metallochaperone HypA [Eubacterium sp.]